MKSLLLVFIGLLVFGFVGCDADSGKQEGGKEVATETNQVGPFHITFDANGIYNGAFDVQIAQPSGKVEFLVDTSDTNRIFEVSSSLSTLYGCNANQTQVKLWWNSDATQHQESLVVNGAVLSLVKGKSGILQVTFQNLDGCTRLKFSMSLKKISESSGPVSSSTSFPSEFMGIWSKTDVIAGSTFKFVMDFEKSGQDIVVSYLNHCAGAEEAMSGTVIDVAFDAISGSTPKKLSVRVDKVSKEFYGACSNVLALKVSDQGSYLNCLAERRLDPYYSPFHIACKLSKSMSDYPQDWSSGEVSWRY